jgi:dephospho-CoA kinase
MARSGLAEREVRSIMAHQVSRTARLAAADDVIDNGGTLEQLRQQVGALHARYLKMAAPAKS